MTSVAPTQPQTLEDYVEYARSIVEKNPQMNESNTKHKLIDPLLRVLGWDLALDVELEYSVQMGRTPKHVDYSLSSEGAPVVFVEAKGCDSDLDEGSREQLRSYLKQQNVDWGLLTNGKRFEVYRRRFSNENIVIDPIGKVSLDAFTQHVSILETLSKKSIISGESERIAANIRELRQARRRLQDNKEPLAEEVIRLITNQIGDKVSQRIEPHAKSFIDDLVNELSEETQPLPNGSKGPVREPSDFWGEVKAETGIQKRGGTVEFPSEQYATESFVSFVRFLFDAGYLTEADLPLQFGRKRYLVNTEPIHSDDEPMRNGKEVKPGVYTEAHNSADGLKRNVVQLADYCR